VVRCWRGYLSGARCKCFAFGPADATATPSPLAPVKSRMVYLSGSGLPRLSWKVVVVAVVVVVSKCPAYLLVTMSLACCWNDAVGSERRRFCADIACGEDARQRTPAGVGRHNPLAVVD